MVDETLAIDVQTPLGFRVTCTWTYWTRIESTKPDEVRRSAGDPSVLLFHRRVEPRWVCAVAKKADGRGYLITAYPADKVKDGELVWKK